MEQAARGYCFHDFVLRPRDRMLTRGSETIELQRLPFRILAFLVEQRHRVVSIDELTTTFWPSGASHASLYRAVATVRRALRDGGAGGCIRTYPGEGYRFACACEELD